MFKSKFHLMGCNKWPHHKKRLSSSLTLKQNLQFSQHLEVEKNITTIIQKSWAERLTRKKIKNYAKYPKKSLIQLPSCLMSHLDR